LQQFAPHNNFITLKNLIFKASDINGGRKYNAKSIWLWHIGLLTGYAHTSQKRKCSAPVDSSSCTSLTVIVGVSNESACFN